MRAIRQRRRPPAINEIGKAKASISKLPKLAPVRRNGNKKPIIQMPGMLMRHKSAGQSVPMMLAIRGLTLGSHLCVSTLPADRAGSNSSAEREAAATSERAGGEGVAVLRAAGLD